jgi:hypothetical protein
MGDAAEAASAWEVSLADGKAGRHPARVRVRAREKG